MRITVPVYAVMLLVVIHLAISHVAAEDSPSVLSTVSACGSGATVPVCG
ncbi:MAG: hypothetical protein ABIJ00_12640 [Candidatus Eisenbacteria bacterium]